MSVPVDYTALPARELERHARNIQPGGWAVESRLPLSTLLGSCVAVCLFDPHLRIGGINHFMLPDMGRSRHGDIDSLLSGNFAMEALLNALLGPWSRKVLFLPCNGQAFCKRMVTSMATADVIAREERAYAESLRRAPASDDKKIELF